MTLPVSHVLALVGAAFLMAVVAQDAFEVMLLPRRVQRRLRLTRVFYRTSWPLWRAMGQRLPAGPRREGFLSHFGPLSMLLLFAIWATGLITSFGMLEWALEAPGPEGRMSPLGEQIYMSGVTFFTLGYGDVVPHSAGSRLIAVVEAGSGIGFIAIVIGYLPVLYQLFSRREAHVIQLDGRAGSPPTAGQLLTRHAEAGGLARIDELLHEWEGWGSELLESHLSYPMLAYYRSQHQNQSWLVATGCIMDTCSLVLVGVGNLQPLTARMAFAMGRQVLVQMAESFGVRPTPYAGGDRLDDAGFARLATAFAEAGLAWDSDPPTQGTLAALRATYEPLLDGLSRYLLLPVPGWMPEHSESDNWERGHRGMIASRLIHELSARGVPPALSDSDSSASGLLRSIGRSRPSTGDARPQSGKG